MRAYPVPRFGEALEAGFYNLAGVPLGHAINTGLNLLDSHPDSAVRLIGRNNVRHLRQGGWPIILAQSLGIYPIRPS